MLSHEAYSSQVDLWSVGVIVYIPLCGFLPFYGDNDAQMFKRIKAVQYKFLAPYWDPISADAKDFVQPTDRRPEETDDGERGTRLSVSSRSSSSRSARPACTAKQPSSGTPPSRLSHAPRGTLTPSRDTNEHRCRRKTTSPPEPLCRRWASKSTSASSSSSSRPTSAAPSGEGLEGMKAQMMQYNVDRKTALENLNGTSTCRRARCANITSRVSSRVWLWLWLGLGVALSVSLSLC